MQITPIPHPLRAAVRVPGSKSLTNRALALAALADGVTTLTNTLESDDSRYFADSLQRLGFELHVKRSNPSAPLREASLWDRAGLKLQIWRGCWIY